jgi:predicted amidohydrolase YtcJ
VKTLLFLALLATTAPAQRCPIWDVVYYNGNILTGKDLQTPTPERVKSLAVQDGRIVVTDPTNSIYGCAKENIDLHGAFVMPGFNDAHTHIASAGQQRLSVDLDGTASLAEMQQRIRDYVAKAAPGTWILGGGWDHTKWPPIKNSQLLPARQDLDQVTAGHPALLYRTDGHIAIANTAALTAAGITAKTTSPAGGKIDLDPNGDLTGIIRESPALALIEPHIPKPTMAVRRQALTLALNDALAHGVTSVQDFSDWDDFLALEAMEHDNQLHVRVSEWLTFNDPIATLKEHQAHHPLNDPMLHTGMLKGFMDGSLGSRTAALAAPYTDDPTNSGIPRYDQQKLNALALERSGERTFSGFQLGFHAIGDRANTMALDAFEAVNEAVSKREYAYTQNCRKHSTPAQLKMADACTGPPRPSQSSALRFRIEHAQVLLPADFDRFAKLHIIASMQPSHLLTDMNWAEARLGPERAKYAYAWKSFLNHGVTLAFGTDYPVESVNPFRGLYSAITRQNEAGTQTFQPQEKLTLNEALYAYTQGSAFAENAEKKKGILAPGFYADFIILDRDITKATPQDLLHTKVQRTVVGGQTVYQSPN